MVGDEWAGFFLGQALVLQAIFFWQDFFKKVFVFHKFFLRGASTFFAAIFFLRQDFFNKVLFFASFFF